MSAINVTHLVFHAEELVQIIVPHVSPLNFYRVTYASIHAMTTTITTMFLHLILVYNAKALAKSVLEQGPTNAPHVWKLLFTFQLKPDVLLLVLMAFTFQELLANYATRVVSNAIWLEPQAVLIVLELSIFT
jgi:hypothetical protein